MIRNDLKVNQLQLKRYFPLLALLLFYTELFGQETRWRSSVYLDLHSSYRTEYSYIDVDNKRARAFSVGEKGAFEMVYNMDYRISNTFSISAIGGLSHYLTSPNLSTLKVGSGIKIFYINVRDHYITLQLASHLPFSKKKFRSGVQLKLGNYFQISDRFLVGLYYNVDFFDLQGRTATPLASIAKSDQSIRFYSAGISLGIKL